MKRWKRSLKDFERRDYFSKLMEEIKYENEFRGMLILVEGARDVKTLRKFGISGPILCIKSWRYSDLIEYISLRYSRVLILSDWDPEGERIFYKMMKDLEECGVKVERAYRERIKSFARKEVKDVEGLKVFLS